jgi:hypothetical protein
MKTSSFLSALRVCASTEVLAERAKAKSSVIAGCQRARYVGFFLKKKPVEIHAAPYTYTTFALSAKNALADMAARSSQKSC